VDAYRLATAVELEDLDLDWEHAIVVVEWGAGKLDEAGDRIVLAIERPAGGDPLAEDSRRTVRISGVGPRWAGLDGELNR
jgi:tRNA threonylcarbamoyladenosine biosynthesis protein TsaE